MKISAPFCLLARSLHRTDRRTTGETDRRTKPVMRPIMTPHNNIIQNFSETTLRSEGLNVLFALIATVLLAHVSCCHSVDDIVKLTHRLNDEGDFSKSRIH